MFENGPLSMPEGVLVQAGMDAAFVAHFALFLGVLLLSILFFGKALRALFRIPIIAGQIIAGIILGPSLLNIKQWTLFAKPVYMLDHVTNTIFSVASSDLFLFFVLLLSSAITVSYLMWIAGHETDISDIIKVGVTASSAGILGALIPIAVIFVAAYYGFGYSSVGSLGIGIIFSATSVSIPVALLISQRKMHLRTSKATLGAAIIDDIAAVIILSVYMLLINAGFFGDTLCISQGICHDPDTGIVASLASMIAGFIIIFTAGFFAVPPTIRWLKRVNMGHLIAPVATGFMLLFFSFAELFGGIAGITGAYFSGLFHKVSDQRHYASKVIDPFVNNILLPLFLGSIGLMINISVLSFGQWLLVFVLLAIAVISKLMACFGSTWLSNVLGHRAQEWSLLEGYLFGSSMVARGEVGLVIAMILSGTRLISQDQYVICVVVIVLTTIAAPIMLSMGFAALDKQLIATETPGEYELNIGRFKVVGTNQMFNVILNQLEAHHAFNTSLQMSEGRRIINLEGHNVKILLEPERGIILKGDRQRIVEIINFVRDAVLGEVGAISLIK